MVDQLIAQIDSLPKERRRMAGVVRSGEEVIAALPSVEEFLRVNKEKLAEAMLWCVAPDGRLVMGDGCSEPAPETLNKGYVRARYDTIRAAYIDARGGTAEIQLPQMGTYFLVRPNKVEIGVGSHATTIDRSENKLLWVRRLAAPDEYKEVNEGRFELNRGPRGNEGNKVWLKGEDDPHVYAPLGWYDGSQVQVHRGKVYKVQENRGARRVIDHYLYFND